MFRHSAKIFSCLIAVALAAPTCNDNVSFVVSASGSNLVFPASFNISTILSLNTSSLLNLDTSLPSTAVTGTYTITGRYCEPEVFNTSRHNTVQLLVHGVGYTRNYWSGLGAPGTPQQFNGTNYSWVDYASRQGYPTFSVDRICNGNSSHPNGLTVCQLPFNSVVLHQVIQNLRAGVVGDRSFSKVIWVGHSLGSLIGNLHAQNYPSDVDSYVLTGFTDVLINGILGTLVRYQPLPAIVVDPVRFAGLIDLSYLTSASRSGYEDVFYYGDYVESVVDADFASRGTVTVGEVATVEFGQQTAAGYTGSVFVLTGQEDAIFCATLLPNLVTGATGNCGQGANSLSSQVRNLYPAASTFDWSQTANTGHDLNLHYTALESFKVAHNFLARVGF